MLLKMTTDNNGQGDKNRGKKLKKCRSSQKLIVEVISPEMGNL